MLTIQAKLIIALALSLALGGMWLGLSYYKDKAKTEKDRADMIQAGATLYQEAVVEQAKEIKEYQTNLEALTNENNSRRDAANNGTKRVYIKAICPATEAANTTPTEANAELTPITRQDYFNLRQGIIALEANYSLCLKQLD